MPNEMGRAAIEVNGAWGAANRRRGTDAGRGRFPDTGDDVNLVARHRRVFKRIRVNRDPLNLWVNREALIAFASRSANTSNGHALGRLPVQDKARGEDLELIWDGEIFVMWAFLACIPFGILVTISYAVSGLGTAFVNGLTFLFPGGVGLTLWKGNPSWNPLSDEKATFLLKIAGDRLFYDEREVPVDAIGGIVVLKTSGLFNDEETHLLVTTDGVPILRLAQKNPFSNWEMSREYLTMIDRCLRVGVWEVDLRWAGAVVRLAPVFPGKRSRKAP